MKRKKEERNREKGKFKSIIYTEVHEELISSYQGREGKGGF